MLTAAELLARAITKDDWKSPPRGTYMELFRDPLPEDVISMVDVETALRERAIQKLASMGFRVGDGGALVEVAPAEKAAAAAAEARLAAAKAAKTAAAAAAAAAGPSVVAAKAAPVAAPVAAAAGAPSTGAVVAPSKLTEAAKAPAKAPAKAAAKAPAKAADNGGSTSATGAKAAASSASMSTDINPAFKSLGVWWQLGKAPHKDGSGHHPDYIGPQTRMKARAAAEGHRCELQAALPKWNRGKYNAYGSFPAWEDALAAMALVDPDERHFYELIPKGRPVKPYLDFDCDVLPSGYADVGALVARVQELTTAVFREDLGVELVAEDFVWLESPKTEANGKACSLHLVIATHGPQLVYRVNAEAKHLAARLAPHFMGPAKECENGKKVPPKSYVDLAVYSKNRLMRLAGSSKFEKTSKLQTFGSDGDTEVRRDSVITWLDDEAGGGDGGGGGGGVKVIELPPHVVEQCEVAKAKPAVKKAKAKAKAKAKVGSAEDGGGSGGQPDCDGDGDGDGDSEGDGEGDDDDESEDGSDASSVRSGATTYPEVSEEQVRAFAACLSKASALGSRDKWRAIGLSLRREGILRRSPDMFWPDWHAFSALAQFPKYPGEAACRVVWDDFTPSGEITLGTLRKFAKEDSPEAYREASRGERDRPVHSTPVEEAKAALIAALSGRFPDHFGGGRLSPETTSFRPAERGGFVFVDKSSGVGGLVGTSLRVDDQGGAFLGRLLEGEIVVKGPLDLHKHIGAHEDFVYSLESEDLASLRNPETGTKIDWVRPSAERSAMVIHKPGCADVEVYNVKKIQGVRQQIVSAMHAQCELEMPGVLPMLVNYGNIFVNIVAEAPRAPLRAPRRQVAMPVVCPPEVRELMLDTNPEGHATYAEVVARLQAGRFVYTTGENQWYHFDGRRWEQLSNKAHPLELYIESTVATCYLALASELAGRRDEASAETVDRLTRCAERLKHQMFMRLVVAACERHFTVPRTWADRLDSVRHIIGFEDGVYDFKTNEYRAARPEDMVSWSTKHTVAAVRDAPPELLSSARALVESCFVDPEVGQYMLREFAYCLAGNTANQRFFLATGTGSNGKSMLAGHIERAFGEYFYTCDIGTFMSRGVNKGTVLSPETVKLRNRRFTVTNEPEVVDELRSGFVKGLVGKDKIQARALHKSAVEFVYFGGIQINCNALPVLTDWSFGMRRRIRVVPYEFTFTPNPDPAKPMERISAPEVEGEDPDAPQPVHAALLGVLIAVYRASDKGSFPPPRKVEYASDQYTTSSNPVALFIEDALERGGPDDFVLVPAVFDAWRASYHGKEAKVGSTRSGFGKILPKEFVSVPERQEGNKAGKTRVYYGWRFRTPIVHPVDAMEALANDSNDGAATSGSNDEEEEEGAGAL